MTPLDPELLRPLYRDDRLGPATVAAFGWLYSRARCRPCETTIHAQELGAWFCRSERSARDWLARMERAGLIETIETGRNGVRRIYIYHPLPEHREPRPDPQRRLQFEEEEEGRRPEAVGGRKEEEEGLPARPTASSLQPPASPPARPTASSLQPPASPPSSGGATGVSAQEPPGVSAQKPPCENEQTPQNRAFSQIDAGVSAQKPPRHAVCYTKDTKVQESILPRSQRKPKPPLPLGTGGDSFGAQTPFAAAVTEALDAATDRLLDATTPAEQKARLVAEIMQTVGRGPDGKQLADWVAGAAADLVVYHDLPEADLTKILVDVREMRRAGSLQNGPAFFHAKITRLVRLRGSPWPGKRPIAD